MELGRSGNLALGISQRQTVIHDLLYFAPYAGVQVALLEGRVTREMTLITYEDQGSRYDLAIFPDPSGNRFTLYASVGATLSLQLPYHILLSLRVRYHHGLQKPITGLAAYRLNSGVPVQKRYTGRGTHLPIQLGVTYPISRLWGR